MRIPKEPKPLPGVSGGRGSQIDEEEYQEEEEDFFNTLKEERQHRRDVERMRDQMEGAKGCVVASEDGKQKSGWQALRRGWSSKKGRQKLHGVAY